MNAREQDSYPDTGDATWTTGTAPEPPAGSWDTYGADPDSPTYDTGQRYRYLLRIASAADLQRAHFESFVRLDDGQRETLRRALAAFDRTVTADAGELARVATAAEKSHPNTMARLLGLTSLPPAHGVDEALRDAVVDGFVRSQAFDGLLGPSEEDERRTRDR